MNNIVRIALAFLALVPAGLADKHQRLHEKQLTIDARAGSNGGPMRTTGYFDVRRLKTHPLGITFSGQDTHNNPRKILQINKGRMFFWFFEAQKSKPEDHPLIIWMTGMDVGESA